MSLGASNAVLSGRRVTKRLAVQAFVRQMIARERLQAGEMLVSEHKLSQRLGVATLTVRRALGDLADEGLIYRIQGQGTFVGPKPGSREERGAGPVRLCLVLPDDAVALPHANPQCWHMVQGVLQAMVGLGDPQVTYQIVTRAPSCVGPADMAVMQQATAVLFLGQSQFSATIDALIDQAKSSVLIWSSACALPVARRAGVLKLDGFETGRRATEHLIGAGYKRIGFVGGDATGNTPWLDGFCHAHEAHAVAWRAEQIVDHAIHQEDGGDATQALMQQAGAAGLVCDAILVDSDIKAVGAVECLRRMGKRVPQDVAVLSCGGVEAYVAGPPFLTSMRWPLAEMMRTTVDQLRRLGPGEVLDSQLAVVGQWVAGRTCRPYAATCDQSERHET